MEVEEQQEERLFQGVFQVKRAIKKPVNNTLYPCMGECGKRFFTATEWQSGKRICGSCQHRNNRFSRRVLMKAPKESKKERKVPPKT